MVRSVGFEPTCGLPHLPLRQACMPFHHERDDDYGEGSGSRTLNPAIKSRLLLPIELRAH